MNATLSTVTGFPGVPIRKRRPAPSRPPPEKDLLLVFLVGEAPTSGINRVAFDRAWTYASELGSEPLPICQKARSNSKSCIAILGPSFTGSLPSLKLLLERKSAAKRYETFVISGAITGEDPSTLKLPAETHFCT